MLLVGKTLKSKINGEIFFVKELFTDQESNREYYLVSDKFGNVTPCGKEWFEKGLMQNLEIVN